MSSPDRPTRTADRPKAVVHLDPAQRAALGRAARAKLPRSAHAEWAAGPNRADPVALLRAQEATRVPELVPLRHERMLESPFTFCRGAAVIIVRHLKGWGVPGAYLREMEERAAAIAAAEGARPAEPTATESQAG